MRSCGECMYYGDTQTDHYSGDFTIKAARCKKHNAESNIVIYTPPKHFGCVQFEPIVKNNISNKQKPKSFIRKTFKRKG